MAAAVFVILECHRKGMDLASVLPGDNFTKLRAQDMLQARKLIAEVY